MIETAKQVKEALAEIQALTGWTNSRLADKVGVHRSSIGRLLTDEAENPSLLTMEKIDKELKRVRKVHG